MATNKPTQKQVVLELFLKGPVTGSMAYKATKARCKCGTLNLHVVMRELKEMGCTFRSEWRTDESGTYKIHTLDRKKTPKILLKFKI